MTTAAMRRRQVARRVQDIRAAVAGSLAAAGAKARSALSVTTRMVHLAAMPGSVICIVEAIVSLPPAETTKLIGRSLAFTAPDGKPVSVAQIPAVITWPLQAAYAAGRQVVLHPEQQTHCMAWLGAGASLIVLANSVQWARQTITNRATKVALSIWITSLAFNMFDVVRVAALPGSWDTSDALTGWPNGAVLRWAEIVSSVALLSFYSVMHANRVAPHVIGPFAKLMNPVRRGLTWRVAFTAAVLPAAARNSVPVLVRLTNNPTGGALIAHVLEGSLIGLFLWKLLFAGIAQHLGSLLTFGWQIVRMQPPVRRGNPPPSPPNRGS